MSENDRDKDSDKITPVDLAQNETQVFANQTPQISPDKPSGWVWFSLATLSIVALLVIFVLPSIVSDYELPLERRVEISTEQAVEIASTISPFEEAQRSLQRKEAQDVLAELLANQAELELLEVTRWAQQDYDAALSEASIGDEYYRAPDFLLARESYEASRAGLSRLLETVPTVLTQTLLDAEQALLDADSTTAINQFSLALLFDPENEAAKIGLGRAESLDEVSGLLAQADGLLDSGELDQARERYRQVLGLDSYNQMAQDKLRSVSAQITDNEFARIMSSGYALLESGELERAIEMFESAADLGVKQDQVLAAITQTENEIANVEISRLRGLIGSAERDELWQAAVDEYSNVLAIDANLLFAIDGRDYAQKRERLNVLLLGALNNPERLSEVAVFEQTLDVYYTGRAIEDPGTVLVGQLDELESFLESSQVPIDIQLVSDNLTDVTLLKIGNLGSFEQTAVSLKPGRYVAVGKRSGYREVREEFTVGFGLTPSSVLVQCDERIVATSRR